MWADIEGGIMYGYKIINGKAVIDDKEAGIIISIFNSYISGLSMKAAAAAANSHGVLFIGIYRAL